MPCRAINLICRDVELEKKMNMTQNTHTENMHQAIYMLTNCTTTTYFECNGHEVIYQDRKEIHKCFIAGSGCTYLARTMQILRKVPIPWAP
jgi:hypothetical protein